jgi:hypothetical protein
VVEGVAVACTGPARIRRRLDGDGRVAIEDDGPLVAEGCLQDADGSWTAWRAHRYSPLP